ncbi:hypothetical protein F2P81_018034 [Scophthalmus maximus]|uniref:Uncharacterized protein n=1 Tax=Scophthalmus maximus TaxID=52904 RepID=A0A6A4S8P8_SCOMX|nr:hypothetical protein F2P81_018034 [Scophthalmus maximus]
MGAATAVSINAPCDFPSDAEQRISGTTRFYGNSETFISPIRECAISVGAHFAQIETTTQLRSPRSLLSRPQSGGICTCAGVDSGSEIITPLLSGWSVLALVTVLALLGDVLVHFLLACVPSTVLIES